MGILIAGVLGLTVTTGVVLLIEHLDTRIRSARDVVVRLGAPLLGAVKLPENTALNSVTDATSSQSIQPAPEPTAGSPAEATVRSNPLMRGRTVSRPTSPGRPNPDPSPVAKKGLWFRFRNGWRGSVQRSRRGQRERYTAVAFNEACRLAHANICNAARNQRGSKLGSEVVFLTSPEALDGKAFFAQGLVDAWSESGERIAYVRLHSLLSDDGNMAYAPNSRDAQEDASSAVSLDRPSAQRVTRYDLVTESRADVATVSATVALTKGGAPPSNGNGEHSPVLTPAQTREALNTLGETTEVVIVDGPAVLPSADAAILSAQATSTVLVVEAGRTTLEEAQDAIDTLLMAGGNVLGVILIS
ncbi:MAG: hypothetical protein HC802_20370 [Caldilineaceae bacterium]|nr:hypothetical protein [Caldilineaceae bacterium]